MTSSKILLFLCLSFTGGIFLDSFLPSFKLSFLILSFLTSLLWTGGIRKFLFFILCSLFFILGVYRHQLFLSRSEDSSLKDFIGQEVVLVGMVDSPPSQTEKISQLTLQLENMRGKILVSSWKYPQYKYGDKLKLKGKLEEPQSFEDFNYKDYLAKDGIYALMPFPEIGLIGKDYGNPVFNILFSVKKQLKRSIARLLPCPQAGLLEALLFGDEENVPEVWKEKFNKTGTRHIAAVSGMNITIISFLILNSLLALGFWRQQAFYLSVTLIIFYVLSIGAPPSGVRAAIMGILLLAAQHFGRASRGLRPVVFAGALMLFFNPLLLKSDIGFQLSFLAILGLVFLQPSLLSFLKKVPETLEIRYSLASTLAAQFFVLPLLVYNFGQLSLISPLSNIFVIPLLPLITILGFFLALAGLILLPLGRALVFVIWPLLTYLLKVVDIFSALPSGVLILPNISFGWIIASYLILGVAVWQLQKRERLRFLK